MHRATLKKICLFSLVTPLFGCILLGAILLATHTHATNLAQTLVSFDQMKINSPTTGTVCANPTTASVEADVQVTFPTGYTVSTTTGNWTVSTTSLAWPTGGTAWPGIGTASAAALQTVTFPSTDLTPGTLYCFNWTNTAALSIKSSATTNNSGDVTTRDASLVTIDRQIFRTSSIDNNKIIVSAVVPQSFSFSITTNNSSGNLSSTSPGANSTKKVLAISTNSKNGWYTWARIINNRVVGTETNYTVSTTKASSNNSALAGTGTITVISPSFGLGAQHKSGFNNSHISLAKSNGTNTSAILTLTSDPAKSTTVNAVALVGACLF